MHAYRDGYDDGVAADLVAELGRVRLACAAAAALELSLQGTNTAVSMSPPPLTLPVHGLLQGCCRWYRTAFITLPCTSGWF